MTTQTKGRAQMLKRLFGKGKADQIIEALEDLDSAVGNAGVEKKELGFDEDVYQSMIKALSKEKGILENLAKAVDGLLAKVGGEQPDVLRNKIIAQVMSHLAQVGIDGEEEEEEVVVEEEVPGDEMPVPEEEEEEEEEELMNFAKSLIKENNAMHEDVKALAELVPAFIDVAASVKELVPLVAAATKVKDMESQLAELQKKVAGRPRIASKDNGNVVPEKGNEKILEDIKEGTEGESTFFNHRLKKS